MSVGTPTLGTLLRNLIEHLDGAVEQAYERAGLEYRPRYTPVMRALMESGPVSIRTISNQARVSHSAASQTVSQMVKGGLVALRPGSDGREHIVAFTARGEAMLPALKRQWAATQAAAARLDAELSAPLSNLVLEALEALEREPFSERIEKATRKQRT